MTRFFNPYNREINETRNFAKILTLISIGLFALTSEYVRFNTSEQENNYLSKFLLASFASLATVCRMFQILMSCLLIKRSFKNNSQSLFLMSMMLCGYETFSLFYSPNFWTRTFVTYGTTLVTPFYQAAALNGEHTPRYAGFLLAFRCIENLAHTVARTKDLFPFQLKR